MENMVMDMGMKAWSEIDEYLEKNSTTSTLPNSNMEPEAKNLFY